MRTEIRQKFFWNIAKSQLFAKMPVSAMERNVVRQCSDSRHSDFVHDRLQRGPRGDIGIASLLAPKLAFAFVQAESPKRPAHSLWAVLITRIYEVLQLLCPICLLESNVFRSPQPVPYLASYA